MRRLFLIWLSSHTVRPALILVGLLILAAEADMILVVIETHIRRRRTIMVSVKADRPLPKPTLVIAHPHVAGWV